MGSKSRSLAMASIVAAVSTRTRPLRKRRSTGLRTREAAKRLRPRSPGARSLSGSVRTSTPARLACPAPRGPARRRPNPRIRRFPRSRHPTPPPRGRFANIPPSACSNPCGCLGLSRPFGVANRRSLPHHRERSLWLTTFRNLRQATVRKARRAAGTAMPLRWKDAAAAGWPAARRA